MSVEDKLNKMKVEIAAEFGIENYDEIDKGELSARINGKIGGEMVKRLVELGKASLEMEASRELVPIVVNHNKQQQKVVGLHFEDELPPTDEKSYFPRDYLI